MKEMMLNETSTQEFINWCNENKNRVEHRKATDEALKVVYNHYVKNGLKVKGKSLSMSLNDNVVFSHYTEPLDKMPTRDEFVFEMFHEVWCKTLWAVRNCSDESCPAYSYALSTFGKKTLKEINEASAGKVAA